MTKSILLSIALMFVITISKAQTTIPNSGFETWTAMTGYNNPNSWACLNDMTSTMSAYTCMKGTPGVVGSSFLKLVSKTITGIGVVPGIAVCGKIDQTTMQATGGFAFTQRPGRLTGSWQHMIYGSSQGYVDIQLTRWDMGMQKRVTVASAHNVLSGMAMSWATFAIPLTYTDSGTPDSCIITLAASGSTPTANDYLYVDNLAFAGNATGISENQLGVNVSLYPNPSSENLFIDLSSLNDKDVSLEIFDIQGKQIKSTNNITVLSITSLDISDLARGNYVLNLITSEGTIRRKFIKQ